MKAIPLRPRLSPLSRLRFRKSSGHALIWWTAFACAAFGVLTGLNLVIVPILAGYSYWIVTAGLILLLAATRQ